MIVPTGRQAQGRTMLARTILVLGLVLACRTERPTLLEISPGSAADVTQLLRTRRLSNAERERLVGLLRQRIATRVLDDEPRVMDDVDAMRRLMTTHVAREFEPAMIVELAWALRSADPRDHERGLRGASGLGDVFPGAKPSASAAEALTFWQWAWARGVRLAVVRAIEARPELRAEAAATAFVTQVDRWWDRADTEPAVADTLVMARATPSLTCPFAEFLHERIASYASDSYDCKLSGRERVDASVVIASVEATARAALDPISSHRLAAWRLIWLGDTQRARIYIERAAALALSARVQLDAALIVAIAGDDRAALIYATTAALHFGEAAVPYLELADVHLARGDAVSALAVLNRGLPLAASSQRARAHQLLAQAKALRLGGSAPTPASFISQLARSRHLFATPIRPNDGSHH